MKKIVLALLAAAALCTGAAAQASAPAPVVFVHGNGDDATKWVPVIWLFESNGYPTNRLFSIRLTDPVARRDNSIAEEFRSSTTDQASELSAFVTRVLLTTGAPKVILVGGSRGGLTIRNYVRNGGGAGAVSHAILCGTPNHGVMAVETNLENEFNGKGRFLRQLNEGSEVVDGVRWMTIRSDKLDKYAQPNVGYDGPELKGAENIVIPNLDHREAAFHPLAFAAMYRFITGQAPRVIKPVSEPAPRVSGVVTGFAGIAPTNRPLSGVHLRVYALKPGSAERSEAPLVDITTTETGAWGPAAVKPDQGYEFVLEKDGRTVSYFMSGLIRSTSLLNLRFAPAAGAPGLMIHRPQGYLSKDRDPLMIDGVTVSDLQPGIPTRDSVTVQVPAEKKAGVRVELRDEVIYARPATTQSETNIAELLWE